mmetsp:Transcript_15049/g.30043  ORF Transcript_15049/g.30043 Transcript_15049/m.30043 type:complete len:132 (+) Transcript_15049:841-1236(+)
MWRLFGNLRSKLYSLSNYYFAQRPKEEEEEGVRLNAPTLAREDAAPMDMSQARAVAPGEVYAAKRRKANVLKREAKLDKDERKRLHSIRRRCDARSRTQRRPTSDSSRASSRPLALTIFTRNGRCVRTCPQ